MVDLISINEFINKYQQEFDDKDILAWVHSKHSVERITGFKPSLNKKVLWVHFSGDYETKGFHDFEEPLIEIETNGDLYKKIQESISSLPEESLLEIYEVIRNAEKFYKKG